MEKLSTSEPALAMIRANYDVEELPHNRFQVEIDTELGAGQLVVVDHNPDFVFFEAEIAQAHEVDVQRVLDVCEENSTLGLLRLDGAFVLRHVVDASLLDENNVHDAFVLVASNAQHLRSFFA